MSVETKPFRMTLAELSQTTEFRHLSPKMQKWVTTYLEAFMVTGDFDATAATKASYDVKNDSSARTFGYQLVANPKILFVLNRFFGTSPEEAFLKQVEKAVYSNKLTIAQVRILELQARLIGSANGLRSRELRVTEPEPAEVVPDPAFVTAPPAPVSFKVGQRITERDSDGVEHVGIIRSLDSAGHPLIVDEVPA